MKKMYLSLMLLLTVFLLVSCSPNRYDDYYIVVFYTNPDQSEVTIDTLEVEKDSKISEPELDLEGKPVIFDGWYKDKDYNEPFDFETDVVDESLTIYVKWIYPEFRIIYVLEEDEINNPRNEEVYVHANVGSNGLRVRDPEKEGYRFRGWYLNDYYPESTTKVDYVTLDLFGEDAEEIRLYPRWSKRN